VDRVTDPVDAGITADGLVLGVDEDDLEVLVGGVLVDPVGVQDAQVSGAAADTLLSSGLKSTLVLELVNTVVGGLACSRNRTLAKKKSSKLQTSTVSARDEKNSYRRWHPWKQGACGHRGGHGHGR
jgi:hypothetical protein